MEFLNKLSSNLGKLLIGLIVVFIVIGVVNGLSSDKPSEVAAAETELWSNYNKAGIYPSFSCSSLAQDKHWLVLCHPKKSATGGLYKVKVVGENQYQINLLNGKAKTHNRHFGEVYSYDSNQSVNISKAMDDFAKEIEG
ncbi:MAG: hypothetical protein ACK5NC_11875 [Vibrio sp.]